MSTLPSANIDSGSEIEITNQYVVFLLDGQRYALTLEAVRRIVRAVEITPLPNAPANVLGAINMDGNILPVFNLRRKFLLPEREIGLNDQFLIATTKQRLVALVVDEAQDVIHSESSDLIALDALIPGLEQVRGLVQFNGDLVLIHDLELFLSSDEDSALKKALENLK